MSWLAQNWLWIVLGLGVAWWYVSRHGGFGGFRQYGQHGPGAWHEDRASEDRDRGTYRGTGASAMSAPQRAIDPVTRQDVSPDKALTSIYQGRIYYFESADNRQRFETSPQQYAREEFGRPVDQTGSMGSAERERPRRRGGC